MDLLIGLVERGRGDSLKIDQTKKDDEVGVGVVGNEKKKQEGVDSLFSNCFSLLRKGNEDKIRACFIAIVINRCCSFFPFLSWCTFIPSHHGI